MQLNQTMCLDFEFVIDRKLKLIISTICMGNWKTFVLTNLLFLLRVWACLVLKEGKKEEELKSGVQVFVFFSLSLELNLLLFGLKRKRRDNNKSKHCAMYEFSYTFFTFSFLIIFSFLPFLSFFNFQQSLRSKNSIKKVIDVYKGS